MSTITYLGAGAALALAVAIPATATAQGASPPPSDAKVFELARQQDLPPYYLTQNEKDAYGRPLVRTIDQARRDLGSWEAVRLAAESDRDACDGLTAIDQLETAIRAGEEQVRKDQIAVDNARTTLEKRIAERRLKRSQNNLLRLLLTGIKLGLVSQIPGVGWAYGGYVLAHEADQLLGRHDYNKELKLHDESVDLWMDQMEVVSNYLRLYDKRLELSSGQNRLWRYSMTKWCTAMRPYYARLSSTSASYTPAPTSNAKPKDWEGFK